MNTYCTIINTKYLPYARVLHQSILKNNPDAKLQVLITDSDNTDSPNSDSDSFCFYSYKNLLDSEVGRNIYKKYSATNADQLRWALKPVLLLYLLKREFDKVIFIDPDMYFVNGASFLFDELDSHNILLATHNGIIDPLIYEDGLYSVLRNGMFSGGFIGATKKGIRAIEWWAGVCHYKIERVKELGLYDDQKYLDLFPLIDPSTTWLKHPGCNLENINSSTQKRELIDGKIKINKTYDPVFIHFTKDTITNIENGNDALLQHYLKEYSEELVKAGYSSRQITSIPNSTFYLVKRKLLLRTRLKRFFFKLAEKL